MFSVFSNVQLQTEYLDYHTYQFVQEKNLRYPRYNKITLSELNNTYHEQACLFWSRMIKGFSFEDDKNAEKIKQFLKDSIINNFSEKKSFIKHIQQQLYNYAKYRSFQDSLIYASDQAKETTPAFLTTVNTKYLYWDSVRKEAYTVVPNADFRDNNEPGTEDDNRDYRVDSFKYVRLGYERSGVNLQLITGSQQRIKEFAGLGSVSDFYANIPYLDALGSMRVNKKIGDYDESWLENGSIFKNVLLLNGLSENNPADRQTIAKLRKDFNNAARHGSVYVISNPRADIKDAIQFKTLDQVKKEDFNQTRDINRDTILAAHGLNPTILGIKTNESSLTSTSQSEAINLFKETQLDNLIADLEEHYNDLFKFIDPGYDTKIKLKTIMFEDELKQAQTVSSQLANENILISLGNMDDYNAYRLSIGKKEVKDEQFKELEVKYINGGFSFENESAI